jgi:hypothetical protein
MAIPVVEFSREGYKKNQLQSNEIIPNFGVMASCQKLGIILENKVI